MNIKNSIELKVLIYEIYIKGMLKFKLKVNNKSSSNILKFDLKN